MAATTTRVFRERMARLVVGEAALVVPATLKLGTGRYTQQGGVVAPTAEDTDLQSPVISGVAVRLERNGHAVRISASVPGGAIPYQITEAGVFAADGAAILLDAFLPTQLQAGISFDIDYTLYPEVEQLS